MVSKIVDSYLQIRRATGCGLQAVEPLLRNFAKFADDRDQHYVVAQAAIEVEPNVESTTAGLLELLQLSDPDRAAMGERGRKLIELRYTWDSVAQRMLEVYGWLAGIGPRPATVIDA